MKTLSADELRLLCGELTPEEVRLVQAVWPVAYSAATEDAAKVADGYGWRPHTGRALSVRHEAQLDRGDEIAAAIRALRDSLPPPDGVKGG